MNRIQYLVIVAFLLGLIACQSKSGGMEPVYQTELVETKKITLPVDENTYYLSKRIFPFEENGKEYLFFGNFEKKQYEIILFDLEKEDVHRRIPLQKEGPDGVPGILGCRPYHGSQSYFCFQHNLFRFSVIDGEGKLLKHYSTASQGERFLQCVDGWSYCYVPSFVIDSLVYFQQGPQLIGSRERGFKREDWEKYPLFASLDLRNGKIDWHLRFPAIFDHDVKNPAGGYEFAYDYNDEQKRLVCSFIGYDSLMIIDDLRHVRWADGRSRYLESMRPKLPEANRGIKSLVELREKAQYSHIMYDKYRDVYYRFVEHACQLGPGEHFMSDPKAREFSVIIFDKDFRIIGETKFPGNKYFYKMSFIGRDGLYISENNEANPEFDEDKLVFACFGLQDLRNTRT